MYNLGHKTRLPIIALFITILMGCAAQFVPQYDKAILDGINATNKDMMTLLASVSAGTKKETFPSRADNYNKIIGSLDALEIQAKSRPVPQTKVGDALDQLLKNKGWTVSSSETPSSVALNKISVAITKMRDTDQQRNLTATEVQAFKGHITIFINQAITYESFLEQQ